MGEADIQTFFVAGQGAFGHILLDYPAREVFTQVEAPPLGSCRLVLNIGHFDVQVSEGRIFADGSRDEHRRAFFDVEDRASAQRDIVALSLRWDPVWPKIYAALLQLREEHEVHDPIDPQLAHLRVSPPGFSTGMEHHCWSCVLTVGEHPGLWVVDFDLDGRIDETFAIE